jgi:hypothetical protein
VANEKSTIKKNLMRKVLNQLPHESENDSDVDPRDFQKLKDKVDFVARRLELATNEITEKTGKGELESINLRIKYLNKRYESINNKLTINKMNQRFLKEHNDLF